MDHDRFRHGSFELYGVKDVILNILYGHSVLCGVLIQSVHVTFSTSTLAAFASQSSQAFSVHSRRKETGAYYKKTNQNRIYTCLFAYRCMALCGRRICSESLIRILFFVE